MHAWPFFLEENVNETPTMEEGRLPLGIPSREDVNRGKGAYSKRDIQTQATQLELRVFHFGQDCISTASIVRIRKTWFCTDNSDTQMRLQQAVNIWHQASWALEFKSVRTASLCKIQDGCGVLTGKVQVKWDPTSPSSITELSTSPCPPALYI